MIEIRTISVSGFDGAIHSLRNPYESWNKSDSRWEDDCETCGLVDKKTDTCYSVVSRRNLCPKKFVIGEADMTLCKKLIKGGSEHRKFLRMIHVQFDIRMPRYVATEMDTYKVGTVKNSSSTMHLITKRPLTLNDFSYEEEGKEDMEKVVDMLNRIISDYNTYSKRPDEEKKQGKKRGIFRRIKQLLPEGFMQMATYDMNYETLIAIFLQRKNHRLSEWSGENGICEWILSLPYMKEFIEAMEDK